MGAACCVAARDKTIQHGSSGEPTLRNFRHSPTWSLRWDNRVRIAGEETFTGLISNLASQSDTLDVKSAADISAHVSDGGSSLEGSQMGAQCKCPPNEETSESLRASSSGQSIGKDIPVELKQSTESPQVSDPVSFKRSPSMHLTPSVTLSPPQPKSDILPPSLTRTRQATFVPGHHHQPSDSHGSDLEQISYENTSASTESTQGSYVVSELTSMSHRGPWSYNFDSHRYTLDESSRTSCQNPGLRSPNYQACRICSKLLAEKSPWNSQKIIGSNELSVVAVLVCGHVFHAECLEIITPEINDYDPNCPVCTFGEKHTLKLFEKMLKAEKDLKARGIRKSRNRVSVSNGSFDFDHWKSSPHEKRSPRLSMSSSLKLSAAKPFLRRHFSFGSSKSSNKSGSETSSVRKKGLFWAKSIRE